LLELSHPSCPASSQIGTALAGAGAGTHPVFLEGEVYLAGPYKGAPLSLAIVTPAVSGPYDLGNVVVRSALYVDPVDAQVTVISDLLPQVVQGIPTRLREIRANLDRPGFALNPTNCDPYQVRASLFGVEGGEVERASHFQMANCATLPFEPHLTLRLGGGVRRRGHPAIHATLKMRPGEANLHRVSVTLPPHELLDNSHIRTVCTRVKFNKDSCPTGSLIGSAKVTSPLLDAPLRGSAYLRSSSHGLPDLALDLHGQIDIEAAARVDAVHGGLRTTFETLPDVPVGSVTLDLQGGSKGLIQNSVSLCGSRTKAKVRTVGQNGLETQGRVRLKAQCGSKKGRKQRSNRATRAER
jgi:hypothetical protein